MRLFSRIGDMLDANISQLLERAKQPGVTARKMVSELEDTLAQIKLAASEILHEKARLLRSLARYRRHESEWHAKAMQALEKDREDLAREALEQKLTDKRKAEAVEKQLLTLQTTIDRYQEDISKLEEKLGQAQTRRKQLKNSVQAARGKSAAGTLPPKTKKRALNLDEAGQGSPWVQLDRMTRFSKDLLGDSPRREKPE